LYINILRVTYFSNDGHINIYGSPGVMEFETEQWFLDLYQKLEESGQLPTKKQKATTADKDAVSG